MFLSALLLAAAVQATPVAPAAPLLPPSQRNPSFNRAANAPSALECRQRAIKAREDAIARGEPLNRMPAGMLHHTVIRMVDGCPVSTRVRQTSPVR